MFNHFITEVAEEGLVEVIHLGILYANARDLLLKVVLCHGGQYERTNYQRMELGNSIPSDAFMIPNAASWYMGLLGCPSFSAYFSEVKDPRLVQRHLLI